MVRMLTGKRRAMKQFIILFFAVALAVGSWFLIGPMIEKAPVFNQDQQNVDFINRRISLSNIDLEKELAFFLAKQFGIFEGSFEIVDIVNLNTTGITGTDYLLVTFKAPDGRFCQVSVARGSGPKAGWEILPESFSVSQFASYQPIMPIWMKDLGIAPEQLDEYYRAHPEAIALGERLFRDTQTGGYILPTDWFQTVKPVHKPYSIVLNQEHKITINPNMVTGTQTDMVNSYWKSDYPSDNIGPGYRAYLYGKVKGSE